MQFNEYSTTLNENPALVLDAIIMMIKNSYNAITGVVQAYTWIAGPVGAIVGLLTLPITANIVSRYITNNQT